MSQLDAGAHALCMNEAGNLLETRDVLVFPDAEVGRGDAALGQDGGGFNHHEAWAALRPRTEVDQMPVGCKSIVR